MSEITVREAFAGNADEFVVDGMVIWDQPWLQTKKLVFKSDGILQLSRKGVLLGGGQVTIMARSIQCDQDKPGVIRWELPGFNNPPALGRALPGQSFDPTGNGDHSEGRRGGDGAAGLTGVRGHEGADAPTLQLWTLGISGVGPNIHFQGQDGQNGGVGQDGGDAGNGEKGRHGHSGVFDCSYGGSSGGTGGNGGPGGSGGPGGNGGKGGIVLIMAPTELLPSLTAKTRAFIAGGEGGAGGPPGRGGQGGRGGDGGQGSFPWCRDEKDTRRAGNGVAGAVGQAGPIGANGAEGVIAGIPTTPEAFDARLASGSQFLVDPRLAHLHERIVTR